MPAVSTETLTQLSYFVAAALFILGLKRMSSPVTARERRPLGRRRHAARHPGHARVHGGVARPTSSW